MKKINDREESAKAYDRLAEIYHKKRIKGRDFNELAEQPVSFSLLGNIKRKKVLDAGCGSGIYSKILARKGAEIYGLEISQNMLKFAREHCKNYKIEFKKGSIDRLPYKNNSFDLILASLVIHYLKKPEKAFKEFNRVLKKKGILVFSTHHPVFCAYQRTINQKGKKEIVISDYFKEGKFYWRLRNSKVNIPSYRLSFERLIGMVYKNGFVIEKLKEAFISKNHENLPTHHKKFVELPAFLVFRCRKLR
jgi:ubiquinone/menaquinone biosynthesis C-methylase UbiE